MSLLFFGFFDEGLTNLALAISTSTSMVSNNIIEFVPQTYQGSIIFNYCHGIALFAICYFSLQVVFLGDIGDAISLFYVIPHDFCGICIGYGGRIFGSMIFKSHEQIVEFTISHACTSAGSAVSFNVKVPEIGRAHV